MSTQLRTTPHSHTDTVARDASSAHRGRQTRGQGPAQGSSGLRRLSVIIPTFNEERTIGHTLGRVRRASAWEVIVVDGRSTDRTCEVARAHGATVVQSPPGRGRQLAVGASIATGDTLLFLHADTSLPSDFDDERLPSHSRCGGKGKGH